MQDETKVEQITTVEKSRPETVVKKVTTVATPDVKTEHPQKVFEKKKAIFRSYQIIWYITAVIEVLLIFRFVLKMIGASIDSSFTYFIYTITDPFALPFLGVVKSTFSGDSQFEWSTIIAALVYLLITFGIVELMQFIKPVTPHEVEKEVDSE